MGRIEVQFPVADEQLQREARARDRKMNRDRVTIDWQFTRNKARQKFGYNRNNITRSET
jgi:hypothetical protein